MLSKTLEDLRKAGLTTKDAFNLFNKISAAGALVMSNATEKANNLRIAIGSEEGVGAAARQASEQLNTLQGDLKRLDSAWDGATLSADKTGGGLRKLVQALTWFIELSGEEKRIEKLRSSIKKFSDQLARLNEIDDGSSELLAKDIEKTEAKLNELNNALLDLIGTKEFEIELTEEQIKKQKEEAAARKKAIKAAEDQATLSKQQNLARRTAQGVTGDFTTTGFIAGDALLNANNAVINGIKGRMAALAEYAEQLNETNRIEQENFFNVEIGAQIVSTAFQGMSNVISEALNSTENMFQAFGKFFANFVKGMIIKLISMTVAALALVAVLSLIPGFGQIDALAKVKEASSFGKQMKAAFGLLGGFANGGVTEGGLAMVGERGKEIVNLPKGSRVHSAADTKQMLSGSSKTVVIPDVRLRGEDIYISFKEAERKLGNTR
jgi:hypothetical protein